MLGPERLALLDPEESRIGRVVILHGTGPRAGVVVARPLFPRAAEEEEQGDEREEPAGLGHGFSPDMGLDRAEMLVRVGLGREPWEAAGRQGGGRGCPSVRPRALVFIRGGLHGARSSPDMG